MLGFLLMIIKILLSLMLSIQYVYERVILILNPTPELSFSKRLQKYNFFLIPQAFLKKNFFQKSADKNHLQSCNEHQNPLGLGGQR